MLIIVNTTPLVPANIAKVIPTATGHVTASLVLLDNELTFLALPVFQIVLEVLHFMEIAFSLVGWKQALTAEGVLAAIADHGVFSG